MNCCIHNNCKNLGLLDSPQMCSNHEKKNRELYETAVHKNCKNLGLLDSPQMSSNHEKIELEKFA